LGRSGLTGVLLDTHVLAWALLDSARIATKTRELISHAGAVWVSAISLYEIGLKVRIGKWPEMSPYVHSLRGLVEGQGARWRAVDDGVALRAALMDWTHRDPFDRMIAATAIELDVRIITADVRFDELSSYPGWRGRIW
jgi:PIN domain nuclease of toxin-antitoxin system